jgi:cytochrome c peroxidase
MGAAGTAVADGFGFMTIAQADINQINAGATQFNNIGCNGCHRPTLLVAANNLIFREPSRNPGFRETTFPGGQNAAQRGVDPANPLTFNITTDQPDNVIMVGNVVVARLGTIQRDGNGNGILNIFADLKRHNMGPGLAENIDAAGNGRSTFVTRSLWGLGSTAQYLHDGRATTIREAIREHGGEAQASRDAFFQLNATNQRNLIRFLKNNILFND